MSFLRGAQVIIAANKIDRGFSSHVNSFRGLVNRVRYLKRVESLNIFRIGRVLAIVGQIEDVIFIVNEDF